MKKFNTDAESRLICRLCSNKASLISLFRGKSRTVRDFIRKIVDVTVGVKYEDDSYFDCICYSCVIQTYNILVFKTKSLENQEKLKALIPKTTNKLFSGKKLSDVDLPNYTELKPILSQWLCTKSFLSADSESTDKSSSEESQPTCVKTKVDKSVQTHTPKCFNVSIQTSFKPIMPTVNIGIQTNADIQCNLKKGEYQKKYKIKNQYTQCDLFHFKKEKTKSDVDTKTKDLTTNTKTDSNAIITKKCDIDKYKCVNKTLNNRIKHTSSDKIKSKKLKEHKSFNDLKNLFKAIPTETVAVGLGFTIQTNSTNITNDSSQSTKDDRHLVNDSRDKLVTEKSVKTIKEIETKKDTVGKKIESENKKSRVHRGRQSSKLESKTNSTKNNDLLIKEKLESITLPSVFKNSPKSESTSNKSQLSQSDEATPAILEVVQLRRKPISKPESQKNNVLQIKEQSPSITKPSSVLGRQSSKLEFKTNSAKNNDLIIKEKLESITLPSVSKTSPKSECTSIKSDEGATRLVEPKRKSNSKPESKTTPKNNVLQIKEKSPRIPPNIRNSPRSNKLQPNEASTGLLKVVESVPSSQPITIESSPDPSVYNPLTVDCQNQTLLEVKVEPESMSCLFNLSDTSIVLKTSPGSIDNEPSLNSLSPNSSGLLQKTGKVEYLRTCQQCGRIIHTKGEMVEHRKSHMKCYLCKKRFTSIKKAKEHMNTDCIRKLLSTSPVISLTKIEDCANLTNQYPNVVGQLSKSPKKKRKNSNPEEKNSKKKIILQRSTISTE